MEIFNFTLEVINFITVEIVAFLATELFPSCNFKTDVILYVNLPKTFPAEFK